MRLHTILFEVRHTPWPSTRARRYLTAITSSVIRYHPLDEECTERVFAEKKEERGSEKQGEETKCFRIPCDESLIFLAFSIGHEGEEGWCKEKKAWKDRELCRAHYSSSACMKNIQREFPQWNQSRPNGKCIQGIPFAVIAIARFAFISLAASDSERNSQLGSLPRFLKRSLPQNNAKYTKAHTAFLKAENIFSFTFSFFAADIRRLYCITQIGKLYRLRCRNFAVFGFIVAISWFYFLTELVSLVVRFFPPIQQFNKFHAPE